MRTGRGAALALAVGLAAQSLNAQQPGRAVVQGVVLDEQTREPLSGVSLRLADADGKEVATSTANAVGRFTFTGLAAGHYRLLAERIGYTAAESGELSLGRADTATLTLSMQPSPVLLDSLLVAGRATVRALGPTQQLLHGRLLDDATREPISGATIQLIDADGSHTGTVLTNDQGLFRLVSPVPGAYTVRAERIGYRAASSSELRLMLGDTIRLDFLLSTEAVLLNPILVTASARPLLDRYALPGMQDFFRRMAMWHQRGYFITRERLAEYQRMGYTATGMLSDVGARPARGCNGPTIIWWDGALFDTHVGGEHLRGGLRLDDLFPPGMLEAVELYIAHPIPAELAAGSTRFPCRVVVFWSIRQPKR